MNIIFKQFEGEENWPHAIEMPSSYGKAKCDFPCGEDEICQCKEIEELAKVNAVPFRSEDRMEVITKCWYSETKDLPNPHEDYWQSDFKKIYSVEGKCEIQLFAEDEPYLRVIKDSIRGKKFAILLKEETVKEDYESQDDLWMELSKLWGAYPDKNNPRWEQIKAKFHITRIK